MNGKKAKMLRKLTGFHPGDERRMGIEDGTKRIKGKIFKTEVIVSLGARRDYQMLKKYAKGIDVYLPHYLRKVVS